MNKAIDVARFLVNKFIEMDRPATNMKVQKLLYYAWIDYYKETEDYLFKDKISAWKFGPVVEEVYREFRMFAAMPITMSEKPKKMDLKTEDFLTRFAEKHANESALTLMSRTHQSGKPWERYYSKGNNVIIPFEKIIEIECRRA